MGLLALLLAISALAAFEWAKLTAIEKRPAMVAFVLISIAVSSALVKFNPFVTMTCLAASGLWIVLAASLAKPQKFYASSVVRQMIGILTIAVVVYSIFVIYVHSANGQYWLLGLILIVSVADMAAYFTGRRIGKTKLAPNISPGKTKEGVVGGLFAILASAMVTGSLLWPQRYGMILSWTGVCILTAAFSIAGDLFISVQKRIAQVKDSGTLLPGHGGVLDRIDSMLSAAPVYAFCVVTILSD